MDFRITRLLACAAAGAVSAAALAAFASAPAASLNVTITSDASDCPTQQAMSAAINRVAGHVAVTASDPARATTRLTLAVNRLAGVYRAVLRVQGPFGGERVFEDNGNSCAGLASAVSVSTALLLDQIESSKSREPRLPRPVVPRPAPWRYGIELGGNVSFGLTRPASLGYSLESLVGRGQFMGAAGGLWLPSRGNSTPPGKVNIGLFAITARGCLGCTTITRQQTRRLAMRSRAGRVGSRQRARVRRCQGCTQTLAWCGRRRQPDRADFRSFALGVTAGRRSARC